MKKFAKILSIFAVFALAFSFAGCSSGDNDSSSDDVTISGSGSGGTSSRIPEDFVKITAGTFQMGSNKGLDSCKPVHCVILTRNFYMCDHEVTQKEYSDIVGTNPSNFKSDPAEGEVQDNRPVENVSWYDAIVYCNKLSIKERLTPCYIINGSKNPDGEEWGSVPNASNEIWNAATCDFAANGYRLPTEAEWEYTARAGK